MGNTDGPNDIFNRYPAIAGQVKILHVDARVGLMAGHGRGAVVQNDEGEIVVVKNSVDQTGDAGVEKSGITDKGNNFFIGGN